MSMFSEQHKFEPGSELVPPNISPPQLEGPPSPADLGAVQGEQTDSSVGAAATSWAESLAPAPAPSTTLGQPATPVVHESVLHFLYKGNLANFGLATAATAASALASAGTAWLVSHLGY